MSRMITKGAAALEVLAGGLIVTAGVLSAGADAYPRVAATSLADGGALLLGVLVGLVAMLVGVADLVTRRPIALVAPTCLVVVHVVTVPIAVVCVVTFAYHDDARPLDRYAEDNLVLVGVGYLVMGVLLTLIATRLLGTWPEEPVAAAVRVAAGALALAVVAWFGIAQALRPPDVTMHNDTAQRVTIRSCPGGACEKDPIVLEPGARFTRDLTRGEVESTALQLIDATGEPRCPNQTVFDYGGHVRYAVSESSYMCPTARRTPR